MNELPRDIARLLAQDVEAVCRELLPNGKKVGQEWVTGDSDDSAGSSLKVRLSGPKAGIWADFGGDEKGDLLGLWCACRHISLGKAINEAKRFLKIEDIKAYPISTQTYQRPRRNPAWKAVAKKAETAADAEPAPPPDTPVTAYLKSRGITEETMRAFRLGEMAGDQPPFHTLDGNPGTIVFPSFRVYDDAPAELIRVKYLALKRDIGKDGKEIKYTRLSGQNFEDILFGWQALDPLTRTVALSEGEVDCLSLHQYGVPALSVPMGAGKGDNQKKWIANEYPFLERFDVIYLCMDMDKAGQEVVMELVEQLGRHRCKIVKLPYKDANECLKQGVTLKELADCFWNADYVAPSDLKVAKDFVDQVKALNNPTSMAAVGVPLPWAFTFAYNKFAFRPGEFTVWSGYLGHGKTTLLSHVLIHAISVGQICCVASLEIPGAVSVLKFCRQLTCQEQPTDAEIDTAVTWLGDKLYLYDKIGDSPMADILDVFQYARQRYGATQLVIDSMMMLGIGEDDWNKQAKVGKQLVTFAREHDCHVHLVAHPKKAKDGAQEAVSSDVKGTGTLTNVANNVLLVWQNKKKVLAKRDQELRGVPMPYDLSQEPDAVLTIDKNRATGWTAKIPLWFNGPSTQFLSNSAQLPTLYAPTVTAAPDVIDLTTTNF